MPPFRDDPIRKKSVLQRHALEVAALELTADGFGGGLLVEPGEAGAVERLIAFLHALGERVLGTECGVQLDLRRAQMLLGVVLVVEGADLDQPAAMHVNRRGWDRGFEPGGLGVGNLGAVRFKRRLLDLGGGICAATGAGGGGATRGEAKAARRF